MIKKLEVKTAVITGGTEGLGIGYGKLFVKGVPMCLSGGW